VNVAGIRSLLLGRFASEITFVGHREVRRRSFESGRIDTVLIEGAVAIIIEMKSEYTGTASEDAEYAVEQV
jgi:hypothetical protein